MAVESIADVVFEPKAVDKDTRLVSGDNITVAAMSETEAALFHDDYINLVNMYKETDYSANDCIAQLYLDNEEAVFDFVRAVKERVDRNYQGRAAEGDGLAIDILRAADLFKSPSGVPPVREGWETNVAAVGEANYSGTKKTNEYSGFMVFGYIDRVPSPRVNAVRWEKGPKKIPYKSIDFGINAVVREQVPMQILPQGNFSIYTYYDSTGVDAFQLLGVKVTTADRLQDPTNSPIIE